LVAVVVAAPLPAVEAALEDTAALCQANFLEAIQVLKAH
jgi:hypothetical protein